MKIISGQLKGRNFYMPFGIKPTQDLIRRAIFDILGRDLSEIDFVDLFAGSGSVGLEALSLGARRVLFVEKDPKCAEVIQENLGLLTGFAAAHAEVMNADAFFAVKQLARSNKRFHFIYADPPYNKELAKKTLKTLEGYDILHADSFIILQHHKREILPDGEGRIRRIRERKYANTILSIYQNTMT